MNLNFYLFFNFFFRRFGAIRSEVHSVDFEQYEISSSAGLYFEELANLQVYHSEWAFVTFINLSHFTAESEHLEETVAKIQEFCDKIKVEFTLPIPTSNCEHVMPQLHSLLEEIHDFSTKWFMNRELSAEPRYENDFRGFRRKKRGFLGTITKSLFGTLSEDEGAFYMEQINSLKSRNLQLLELSKKQTTLFQESVRVLNGTMQFQSIQNVALQKHFDDLSFVLKNTTIEANSAQVSSVLFSKISELMQYTSLMIIGFREKQRYFFEAITTKSKSFQLIPPRMFMNELEKVSLTVAEHGLLLPMPLTGDNLSKFYQITTTEGRIIDNNLIVRFSIPLVESKKFVLYKATSAPMRNTTNDTFSFIVPHNEYIAFDSIEDKFTTLTLDEIKNCHRVHSKHLVCKQTFPVMTATKNLGCEINLIRNTNMTSNCDFRTANLTEELWVQLQQPNTYLYTLPETLPVVILCLNSRTSLFLKGTGIISVAFKCRIKTERVEIVAFQTMESKIFRHFAPFNKFNVNVSLEIANAKRLKSPRIPTIKLPNATIEENTKIISQINNDLNELQIQNAIEKASAINVLNAVMNHGEGIGQALLALAVIAIAITVVYTCIKYSLVKGGNIIIFVILVALATAGVLYII